VRCLKLVVSTLLCSALVAERASSQTVRPAAESSDPMAAARAPRHLLRNAQDFLAYGEYDRALGLFREAEVRINELSPKEQGLVREGIEAARRGLRKVEDGTAQVTTGPPRRSSARSNPRGSLVGAMALAEPSAGSDSSSPDGVILTGGAAIVGQVAAGMVGTPPQGPVIPPPLDPIPSSESAVPFPDAPAQLEPVGMPIPQSHVPAPIQTQIPRDPETPPLASPNAEASDLVVPSLPDVPVLPSDPSKVIVSTAETPTPIVPEPSSGAIRDDRTEVVTPTPPERTAQSHEPWSQAPRVPGPEPVSVQLSDESPPPASEPFPVAHTDIRPEELPPLPPPADQIATATPNPTVPNAPVGADATEAGPDFGPISDPISRGPADQTHYPSSLSEELEREVEMIAIRQQTDRSRSLDPTSPGAMEAEDESNLSGSTVELPRAPSPTEARPIQSIPVPEEFTTIAPREWSPGRKYWAAAATCHGQLYFQDATLERYGISAEQRVGPVGRFLSYPLDDPSQTRQRNQIAQPFLSIGKFAAQIITFPYRVVMDPPTEAEYDLGYYRPGDAVPPDTVYWPGVGPPLRGKHY
jgi:hypothetical protein